MLFPEHSKIPKFVSMKTLIFDTIASFSRLLSEFKRILKIIEIFNTFFIICNAEKSKIFRIFKIFKIVC